LRVPGHTSRREQRLQGAALTAPHLAVGGEQTFTERFGEYPEAVGAAVERVAGQYLVDGVRMVHGDDDPP
jgi:hypothetical protein